MDSEMIRRYVQAQRQGDIYGMAAVIRACLDELLATADDFPMLADGCNALAAVGEMELLSGRYASAVSWFVDWLRLVQQRGEVVFSEIYKYCGIAGACMGEFDWARDLFRKVAHLLPHDDEIALYERAMNEAEEAGRKIVEQLPHPPVMLPHGDGWRDVPIFINSRDRLTCLRELLGWLLNAGYRRIYILDNDSTYSPLLNYYAALQGQRGVKVICLSQNLGHRAVWESGVLDELGIRTVYVYTDSDVVPKAGCPRDIVRRLFRLLQRYPFAAKAGPGIVCDDITFWDKARIQHLHPKFYQVPLERDVYFAPLDTTFALYRPVRSYRLFSSLRTTGDMMIRHLPWYLDREHLPEDERYYMEHANVSSTQATSYREHYRSALQ